MYIHFEQMAQVQLSVEKGPPVMRLVVNQCGVQLLMPHSIPIHKPKESIIIIDLIFKEILEEMVWQVGLDTGKDLIYTHTRTNC